MSCVKVYGIDVTTGQRSVINADVTLAGVSRLQVTDRPDREVLAYEGIVIPAKVNVPNPLPASGFSTGTIDLTGYKHFSISGTSDMGVLSDFAYEYSVDGSTWTTAPLIEAITTEQKPSESYNVTGAQGSGEAIQEIDPAPANIYHFSKVVNNVPYKYLRVYKFNQDPNTDENLDMWVVLMN